MISGSLKKIKPLCMAHVLAAAPAKRVFSCPRHRTVSTLFQSDTAPFAVELNG